MGYSSLLLLILIGSSTILPTTNAQWYDNNSSDISRVCTQTETRGINSCSAYGECPTYGDSRNTTLWTCNMWKCHIFCTNPIRSKEREGTFCSGENIGGGAGGGCKGGTESTGPVDVSDVCWDDRTKQCEVAKDAYLVGCDVDCNVATFSQYQYHGMTMTVTVVMFVWAAYW